MEKSKKELKELIAQALYTEYGFSPTACEIHTMSATADATYILFEISGHMYKFNSYYDADIQDVWTGNGTITKF